MAAAPESLGELQRWFQRAVTQHAGIDHEPAIPARIKPSSRLAPRERLQVYANAYVARLVECLEQQFPALRRALGEDGFTTFAQAYLEEHPSTHWSLDRLGAELASFLARTRPERTGDAPDWADMLAELAELEWTVLTVFDGPGIERRDVLDPGSLRKLAPERFAQARLELAPSVALRRFRFPLNEYYARLRDASDEAVVPLPAPGEQSIAFHRMRYRVHRFVLAPDEHALLAALGAGATVASAIERALDESDAAEDELPARVSGWFERFASAAFFVALHDASD